MTENEQIYYGYDVPVEPGEVWTCDSVVAMPIQIGNLNGGMWECLVLDCNEAARYAITPGEIGQWPLGASGSHWRKLQ